MYYFQITWITLSRFTETKTVRLRIKSGQVSMRFRKLTFITVIFGLCILSACLHENASTSAAATATSIPPSTPTRVLPTPSSSGDSIIWDTLRVTMGHLEITQDYLTDYGSSRVPPEGQKFLWVHIRIQNTGQVQRDTPALEHFSLLYAADELKPTYGHRQNYMDYSTFGSVISPSQELDGWIRFDIPTTAKLNDLRFVFLPESAQVGASYGSPSYPYADDKPTYVWNCAP
jgi:hypothetical protein